MYLGEYTNKKSNNLNLIKFFAALAVIISHSYPLSKGTDCVDNLLKISKGSLGLGGLAVAVFFISSGYLVSKSIEKKNDTIQYLKARSVRIFPPLIFTIFLTILVCGLFFTKLSKVDYFFNFNTIKYGLNMILIPVHNLPGVFESNIYGSVVNGALWTLPIEFLCYIILLIIYKLNMLNKKTYKIITPIIFIGYLSLNYIDLTVFQIAKLYLQPMFIFYAGSLFYVFRNEIRINTTTFVINFILFLVFVLTGFGNLATILFFPYIILYVSFYLTQCHTCIAKVGNISYGMYLTGFPIQQMLVSSFGGEMSVVLNMLMSILISIIVGYMVYFLVEKRF